MSCISSRIMRLGLALAATGILNAETPRLGLTAGGAWPTGRTRDAFTDDAGWAAGAFADWEPHAGHTVRLAFDGTFHPKGNGSEGRSQSQALTLNYVFSPRIDLQGLYFVVGAGAMNVQRRKEDRLVETGVKLAWNAGLGMNLNDRWGLLARYHSITDQGRSLGMVTAGLTYRF
jgi:hypothetical protein